MKHLTFFLILFTLHLASATRNQHATENTEQSPCLLLTDTETCSAFSDYSVPKTLFPNVDRFDEYIKEQVKMELEQSVQNCTNGDRLSYITGLTTYVCHFALSVFWRSYQCGAGGYYGAGCQPPILCRDSCVQWFQTYNSLASRCDRKPGTLGLQKANIDDKCADATTDEHGKCISSNPATRSRETGVILSVVVLMGAMMAMMY